MKKIFIIYATAGEGHKMAAVAIKTAFNELAPKDTQIELIDALEHTDNFFKSSYPAIYLFMVTYIPTIWGFFYYWLDAKWFYPLLKLVRRIVNTVHGRTLEKFLTESQPDVIVATHFLASEVAAELKRKNKIRSKLITCVTDFRMHSFWFAENTDCFYVGFEETKIDLTKKWRFTPDRIRIFGMPISPKFELVKNREAIQDSLGLAKGLFTVFVTSGGFGVGPILALVKSLIRMNMPIQILVVCGHNEKLRDQINKLTAYPASAGSRYRDNLQLTATVKTFGFIDYMDELMSVSDVIVTKTGGLICSEAIAKGLPLIITAPIPGQETRNAKLLLKHKAALKLKRPRQIKKIIQNIYSNQKETSLLFEMRENIKSIRVQNSALNIARAVTEAANGRVCQGN
ncbi:MAG: glycosyltransferase [Candidatus Omnitrophica bacterium]|nr:glycosyltransferase [Candidatus Omnitrophota bacterium]